MPPNILHSNDYRTFDSLLEDVKVDLPGIANSGRINPQQLIKVAQRVNYDLGIRIHQVRETVLEVDHRKARLPDDFYVMNFALLCGEFEVKEILPQGTNIWQVDPGQVVPSFVDWVESDTCTSGTSCRSNQWPQSNRPLCLTQCGNGYSLIQHINTQSRHYKYMMPVHFRQSKEVSCKCHNLNYQCPEEAYIKDGFVFLGFECGNLYIHYEGAMVDEDGNLLVLNKSVINSYYEWAVKVKIFESLVMDGSTEYFQTLQYAKQEELKYRREANSIVNTPDFEEFRNLHFMNREAQYQKYYHQFSSYPWDQTRDWALPIPVR